MSQKLRQETPAETVERCAKHGAEWVADRVEFKPSGVDESRPVAKALFARHNFGDYIETDPRPETVLKASAKRGTKPAGYLNRPFVSSNSDTPLAIHVTRVTGNDESGDTYACLARVRIGHRVDKVTGDTVPFAVARPPEGQTEFTDSTARDRAMWIANEANHMLGHIKNADLGDAVRKAIESTGAAKSLGGGNNYYVPTARAEQVHNFLTDVAAQLGIHYVRDPKTTLGASHVREVVAQAVQSSIEVELTKIEGMLAEAVADAANPTLTKKGKPRAKNATNKHKIKLLQTVKTQRDLFRAVLDAKVTGRLDRISEGLERAFDTLLDGGSVTWEPQLTEAEATPPSSDDVAPTTERSPGSAPVEVAASTSGPDPYDWL